MLGDRRLDVVGRDDHRVDRRSAHRSAAAARRRPRDGACPPRRADGRELARPLVRLRRGAARRPRRLEQDRRDVVVAAAAVRGLDQRLRARRRGRRGAARRISSIVVAVDHRREAVASRAGRRRPAAASTANASTSTSGSVPSARVITERCGCTSASLGRQLAAPHELGDERVVVGQLLELVVAQQVGARVADVAEGDAPSGSTSATVIVVPMPGRSRRRSTRARGRAGSPPGSAPTTRRSPPPLASASLERAGGERRGDLAGLRAAHAVGDAKSGGAHDVRVLVAGAACGPGRSGAAYAADPHGSNLRSVSPTRTTSPGVEPALARQADAVHERAVRRADVLDVDAVAARLEARVARRGVLVVRQRDVVVAAAADASAAASRASTTSPSSSAGLATRRAGRARARSAAGSGPRRPPAAAPRIIDSCGRRRSRAAERTIRQMKR